MPGKAATFWADLEPATYYRARHLRQGQRIEVGHPHGHRPRHGHEHARGDSTVKAVRDAKWANKPASIPRKGTLTFKNRSTANHFVALAKMVTRAPRSRRSKEYLMTEEGKPPVDFSVRPSTPPSSVPGTTCAFDYKLPAGTYVDGVLLARRQHGRHAARRDGHDPHDRRFAELLALRGASRRRLGPVPRGWGCEPRTP